METQNDLLNKNTDCSICNFSGDDDKTILVNPISYSNVNRGLSNVNRGLNKVVFEPLNKQLISFF